jgi:hypothetical protein
LDALETFFADRETKQHQSYSLALNRMMTLLHPGWAQRGASVLEAKDGSKQPVRWLCDLIQSLRVASVEEARSMLKDAQGDWPHRAEFCGGGSFPSAWHVCCDTIAKIDDDPAMKPQIERLMQHYTDATRAFFPPQPKDHKQQEEEENQQAEFEDALCSLVELKSDEMALWCEFKVKDLCPNIEEEDIEESSWFKFIGGTSIGLEALDNLLTFLFRAKRGGSREDMTLLKPLETLRRSYVHRIQQRYKTPFRFAQSITALTGSNNHAICDVLNDEDPSGLVWLDPHCQKEIDAFFLYTHIHTPQHLFHSDTWDGEVGEMFKESSSTCGSVGWFCFSAATHSLSLFRHPQRTTRTTAGMIPLYPSGSPSLPRNVGLCMSFMSWIPGRVRRVEPQDRPIGVRRLSCRSRRFTVRSTYSTVGSILR